MLTKHIAEVLMMWFYTIMILFTMTTVSNVTAEIIDSNGVWMCSEHCNCTKKSNIGAITARCDQLNDETMFDDNIKHFLLESMEHVLLESYTFVGSGLSYLKSINIINSGVANVYLRAFYGLNYLTTVEFDNNQGLFINQDVFQENNQLKNLYINQYNNFENNCDTEEDYLFDAPSLTNLTFRVSDYKCWSSSTFTKIPKLKTLCLDTPNLNMTPGMFAPLEGLKKLEIHNANHLEIVENTFNGLRNLRELKFTMSVVSSLFNIYIPSLEYFYMDWVKMININEHDFIGMSNLQELAITYCNIETIHEDAFSSLTQLKRLDISNNNIVSLTENHLRNNFQLEILEMSYNINLRRLPIFRLNSTVNNNYSIYQVQCHDCGLESLAADTFDAMPQLLLLYLNSNQLKSLPSGFFKSLFMLELLDLSHNLISFIPEDMFQGATRLRHLDLSANPLTTLQTTPFLLTPQLFSLNLDMCNIKVWDATNPSLDSLAFLSLENNELENITVEQLRTVPNLSILTALFNPIKCDSVFNETIEWLLSKIVATKLHVPYSNLNCDRQFEGLNCWYIFRNFICDSDYISVSKQVKQINNVHFNTSNTIGQNNDIRHQLFDTILSAIIPLNMIIFTTIITLTIIKFRPYRRVSKEKITI